MAPCTSTSKQTEQLIPAPASSKSSSLAGEIAELRKGIQNTLNKPTPVLGGGGDYSEEADVYRRLDALEKENAELLKITDELRALILTVQSSLVGEGDTKTAKTVTPPAKKEPAKTTLAAKSPAKETLESTSKNVAKSSKSGGKQGKKEAKAAVVCVGVVCVAC